MLFDGHSPFDLFDQIQIDFHGAESRSIGAHVQQHFAPRIDHLSPGEEEEEEEMRDHC